MARVFYIMALVTTAWMAAVVVHEAGHAVALVVQGRPVRFQLTPAGPATVSDASLDGWRRAVVTAAGPAANLMMALILVFRADPLWAICQAIMGVGQLVPMAHGRAWSDGAKLWTWLQLRDWVAVEKCLHQNQHKLEQRLRIVLAVVGLVALGVAALILAAFLLPIVL